LLGKRLTWTLAQLVDKGRQPVVSWNASLDEVLKVMSHGGYGATVVLAEGEDSTIAGIITDGDLRRAMATGDLRGVRAHALANLNPTIMEASMLAADAASALQSLGMSQVVVTQDKAYIGMVHLHDFMRHGLG
jgi:arabinose-5-phosphate isomerase